MKLGERRTALHDLVAESALRHPEQECIVFDSGQGEATKQQRITYHQLWQKVTELKLAFGNLSLKEQIVGVHLADGLSIPSVLIGLLSSSCAFYPFNLEGLQYTAAAFIKAGVSWILTNSELAQKLSPLLTQLEGSPIPSDILSKNGLQLFKIKNRSVPDLSPVKDCDLAYCITTSGTTSAPKVVHVPHSCIVPNITDLRNILQLDVGDRVLLTSPLTFDPSIIDIFCTLSSGACLVIVPSEIKRRPEMLLNILHHRQAVTVMQATPTLVRSFSPSKLKQTLLGPTSSLRVLALGGERFPSLDNLRGWLHPDKNKTQFYNLYGITEISCWASCQYVDVRTTTEQDEPVPIGAALDQTIIKLVPTDGERGIVDSEDEGEIWIGSDKRICFIDNEVYESCQGTCHMLPGERQDILWRNTGDRGKLVSDGSILCLGRRDDQVKRHGKRMNLEAVEMVCKEVTGVLDCCAVLDQSNLMLFIIMESPIGPYFKGSLEDVMVVSKNGDTIPSEHHEDNRDLSLHTQDTSWSYLQQKLKAHIENSLPSHYVPSTFVKIGRAFPLTQNGKLDKKLLVKIGNAEMKARSGTEISNVWTYSQELWMAFLSDSSVNIDSSENFISLGGDSLAAVRVISTLEHVFKCSLPNMLDVLINKDFGCFIEELQKQLYINTSDSPLTASSPALIDSMSDTMVKDNFDEMFNPERYRGTVSETNQVIKMNFKGVHNKGVHNKGVHNKGVRFEKSESSLQSREMSRNKKIKLTSLTRLDKNLVRDENFDLSSVPASVQHYESSELPHKNVLSNMGIGELKDNSVLGTDFNITPEELVVTHKIKRIVSRGKMWQNQAFNQKNSGEIAEFINVSKNCHGDVMKSGLLDVSDRCFNELSSHTLRTALDLRLRWKFDTKKCVDASPLIVEQDGMMLAFIGSHSGQFSAIDTTSGSPVWAVTLPDRIESSACCSLCGAYIIVGCYDGIIYVLDIISGSIIWSFATGDSVKCSPVVDDCRGYIVCGSHDGFLYCLDLTARECVWKCHMGGGSVFSSPAIDVLSRSVYAVSLAGQIMCINIDSGTVKWTYSLHKPVFSSLCLLGHSVLTGCVDGLLYCISSSGQIEWTFQTQAPIFSTPIFHNSAILVGSHDHHLYCLNQDGQQTWAFEASSPVYATSFVSMFVKNVESNTVSWEPGTDSETHRTGHSSELLCSDSQPGTDSQTHRTEHSSELLCSDSQPGTDSQTHRTGHSSELLCSDFQPGTDSQTHHSGHSSELLCSDSQPGTDSQTHHSGHSSELLCSDSQPGTDSQTHHSGHSSELLGPVVVAASTAGTVYVLSLEDGHVLREIKLPGEIFSSPVVVDNLVVVGCRDNFVYCWEIT